MKDYSPCRAKESHRQWRFRISTFKTKVVVWSHQGWGSMDQKKDSLKQSRKVGQLGLNKNLLIFSLLPRCSYIWIEQCMGMSKLSLPVAWAKRNLRSHGHLDWQELSPSSRGLTAYLRSIFSLFAVCEFWKAAHVCAHLISLGTHRNCV